MSNVKGNCIWVLTIVGVLLISIATGFLLLTAGYLIPSEALHDHLMKSAALLSEEKTYPKEAYSRRRLDNFTDSLMLLTSSNNTYDSPFENAVRIPEYSVVENDISPKETLTAIGQESQEAKYTIDYMRYWHGYEIILRPLLLILDYGQIRQLNLYVLFFLLMLVMTLMIKKDARAAVPFALSVLLMSPTAIVDSIQYSTVSYITLLTMLAVLMSSRRSRRNGNVSFVFLLSGIAVAFLDLLTFPTVALTMPLVLLWMMTNRKYQSASLMLKCIACWGIGYAGMWMGKWLIVLAYCGRDHWNGIIGSILFRSGTEWNGEKTGRLTVLFNNFKELFLNPKLTACIICYSVISIGMVIFRRGELTRQTVRKSLMLLIPAFIPILWIIVLANHSWNHTWFTYRTLAPAIFSLLCLIANSFSNMFWYNR